MVYLEALNPHACFSFASHHYDELICQNDVSVMHSRDAITELGNFPQSIWQIKDSMLLVNADESVLRESVVCFTYMHKERENGSGFKR